MTVKALDNHLELYRKLVPNIPLKSKLRTKAEKIDALKTAIRVLTSGDFVIGGTDNLED